MVTRVRFMWCTALFLMAWCCWSVGALAQGGTAPDVGAAISAIIDGVVNHNWVMAISAIVVFLVWIFKQLADKSTAPFLHSAVFTEVLTIGLSVAGVLSSTWMLGQPFTIGTVGAIIMAVLGSWGLTGKHQQVVAGLKARAALRASKVPAGGQP